MSSQLTFKQNSYYILLLLLFILPEMLDFMPLHIFW